MFNTETKQSIKRFIAKSTKPFFDKNDKNLSVILNYHSIHPTHKYSTIPDDFVQQMEYLSANFKILSLADFYEIRNAGNKSPERIAVITFDDGYEDNYEYAFPVLKKLGIKATIFLTTGFINGEVDITKKDSVYNGLKPLKWEQILEMRANGITFGSHTHTHPILTKFSLEDAEREIIHSKGIMEGKLNESVEMFAYPLGQPKTFNSSIIGLLKNRGFKLACTSLWGHVNSNTDAYALPRIRIDACDSLNDFKEKVNGRWDFIRWFQNLRALIS